MSEVPQIALLGSGIFVRTQYIPRLREISHLVSLNILWSRNEESAKAAANLAQDFAPNIVAKWGESGVREIIEDKAIQGVAIVLAGQVQVEISKRMLKAGKHVIQEKPAAGSIAEAEASLSFYETFTFGGSKPIWAIAENYRFEPALLEAAKLVKGLGTMMNVQVTAEAPMNSQNPYFTSQWRRNFEGGFTLDVGVHFIAGVRMVVGYEITSVAAISRHVDASLPPPDNVSALLQFENGCAGVFTLSMSSTSRKISIRVVGSNGTVEVERGSKDNQFGYTVSHLPQGGNHTQAFYPFAGVNEELKSFVSDLVKGGNDPDPRSSLLEGACDVAVIEAMLQSSLNKGSPLLVNKFAL